MFLLNPLEVEAVAGGPRDFTETPGSWGYDWWHSLPQLAKCALICASILPGLCLLGGSIAFGVVIYIYDSSCPEGQSYSFSNGCSNSTAPST